MKKIFYEMKIVSRERESLRNILINSCLVSIFNEKKLKNNLIRNL